MPSLYIHIPFCVRKCLYCGFYSTAYASKPANNYLDALGLEAALYRDRFRDIVFETVYLGGGTPTALTLEQLSRTISLIKEHFTIAVNAEFTVEANPGTLTERKLEFLRTQGVNRLSIGVQSFSDDVLVKLGRIHTAREAVDAVTNARNAGFTNISIDLIYGVPGQTPATWNETLRRTVDLGTEHLSAYSLSYDEGTAFTKEARAGRLVPMADEEVAALYEAAIDVLSRAGYTHYEISNFAAPGFECRHNMNYWNRGEYLGLGPGAWSFVAGRRHANIADVHDYYRRLGVREPVVAYEEFPDRAQAANEAFMLGLRTNRGTDHARYAESLAPEARLHFSVEITRLENAGLLYETNGRLRLTDHGMFVSDEVLAKLAL